MPIATVEDLRTRLQWAIEIEHSIIPPYLCALYSIKPGSNREAVEALTSVFIEEMLHMTLAANVLNAIGGAPVLDQRTETPVSFAAAIIALLADADRRAAVGRGMASTHRDHADDAIASIVLDAVAR